MKSSTESKSTELEPLDSLRDEAPDEEKGFWGPDSISWRVGREKGLMLAGPATVLLQVAHPMVAAGVAEHSDFVEDPVHRLENTFRVVHRIVFGSVDTAIEEVRPIREMHESVRGNLEESGGVFDEGDPYEANQDRLLLWVHATLVEKAIDAYDRFIQPLSYREKNEYYQESKMFARLFGVSESVLPSTYEEFKTYYHKTLHKIDVTERAKEQCEYILEGGPLFTHTARLNAAAFLPSKLREQFGFSWNQRDRIEWFAASKMMKRSIPYLPDDLRYFSYYLERRDDLDKTDSGVFDTELFDRFHRGIQSISDPIYLYEKLSHL